MMLGTHIITHTSVVICNIGDETETVANLQRLVYADIAVAATECSPTQAHSAHEAVIKCRCMKAPPCGERTSSWSSGTQLSG